MQGKKSPSTEVLMEMLSKEYGWTPEQIRQMPYSDVVIYTKIINIKRKLKKNGK